MSHAAVEQEVHRQPVEPRDRDAGDRADECRRQHHLSAAGDERPEVVATAHAQPGGGRAGVGILLDDVQMTA